MSNRFMMSVAAAALIAGTGFAYAQGTGTGSSGPSSGGSTVQQSAPSGGSATSPSGSTTSRDATDSKPSDSKPSPGMKATQSDQKGAAPGMRGDDKMGQSKSMDDKAGAKTNSAQSKDGMSKDKEGMSKDSAQTKSGSTDSKTTGNAATSATAAPPAEKRTQISSAIRQEKVEETTNVNFNISVGTTIPGSVRFHPLPSRIVEIYPEWRGYDFILVRGRYIIVRPQTHEIVYIIEG